MSDSPAIQIADVLDAARLLDGVAVRTPLIENRVLNERIGSRIFIKFEGAQHTGSFKFRGAYNRLARLSPEERAAGVVAWSSGNHAQGVACAARMLDMLATIVMPSDAPAIKADNTRAMGARIIPYDRLTESREDIAIRLARDGGATLLPSFDDPHVMAGQGTVGLEILDQAQEAQAHITQILVCCGGGGLISGIATAVKAARPDIALYSVEPDGYDDTARSLTSGVREQVAPGATSICDALLAPSPGALTFPINQMLLAGGLAVSDAEVRAAMRFAFSTLKLVTEPGGAVALAAALTRRDQIEGDAVIVVASGGNVDLEMFEQALNTLKP